MKPIALIDIDGTIADVRHRLHHISGPGRKNWKAFFAEMDLDSTIPEMMEKVRELERNHEVVIVTGRPEEYRARTEKWLKANGIHYTQLFMRPQGDHRPDYTVKEDVLRHIPKARIAIAIDDRGPVCDMWEKHGIRCIRADSGEENRDVNELYRKKG